MKAQNTTPTRQSHKGFTSIEDKGQKREGGYMHSESEELGRHYTWCLLKKWLPEKF